MFFSTDLLANKAGSFSRIWLLGCGSEKVKGQDNKTNVIKLIKLVQEWIQRQDAKRYVKIYLAMYILPIGFMNVNEFTISSAKCRVTY